MRRLKKIYADFEKKPLSMVAIICLICFIVFFLMGLGLGLGYYQWRINGLIEGEKTQRQEELKRLNRLFEKYSQAKILKMTK